MALVVDVPLNTMLADLDESLRALLKRELGRHGFDGVEVAFDAPARDWSSQLSGPTVNLLPLRPARVARRSARPTGSADARQRPPPRGPAADDHGVLLRGHRLDAGRRGRAPAAVAGAGVLFAFPQLPATCSPAGSPRPRSASRSRARSASPSPTARPTSGRRSAASTRRRSTTSSRSPASRASPTSAARRCGPRRSARGIADGPRGTITEMHRFGGKVLDADGAPLADVWVTLPSWGCSPSSDAQGRFRFSACPPGTHSCSRGRATAGEAKAEIAVPGAVLDLTVRARQARARRRGADRMGKLRLPERLPRPSGARGAPTGDAGCMMPNDDSGRPRVLLGNLEPMVRLGMIDVLAGGRRRGDRRGGACPGARPHGRAPAAGRRRARPAPADVARAQRAGADRLAGDQGHPLGPRRGRDGGLRSRARPRRGGSSPRCRRSSAAS